MKKKLLLFALIGLISLNSCKKEEGQEKVFVPNKTLTIKINENLELIASDVKTDNDEIIRRIDFKDPSTKVLLNSYLLELKCDDGGNILDEISNKKFTGSFIIYSDGYSVMSTSATKGKFANFNRIDTKETFLLKTLSHNQCSVVSVHDCVSFKIEDMNIVEYTLCLASAPGCYSGLWATCAYDVCVKGKTYINPID